MWISVEIIKTLKKIDEEEEKRTQKIYSSSNPTCPTSTLPNIQFGVPLSTKDYKEIYKAISNLYNKDLTCYLQPLQWELQGSPKPRVYKG